MCYNYFSMKANIHPQFYEDAQVICACGHTFTTGSTKKTIMVEVCYKCHPFYTGQQRYIDTKGKVESFEKKRQAAKHYQSKKLEKKRKKDQGEKQMKTLKDLLQEI